MSNKMKKALIAAVALMGFAFANISPAYDNENLVIEEYKVKHGDTFWHVSEVYCNKDARGLYILEYQDELRELNPQLVENKNQLHVGDVLKISYVEKNAD